METFLECCGSSVFAAEMTNRLPFSSLADAIDASRSIWWNQVNVLGWLEAFSAHPRIGDLEALKKKNSSRFPGKEQSAALTTANEQVLQELVEWNKRYEEKFGHIFLICATGKSSPEILVALKKRYTNRAIDELRIAAEEQHKITELRLAKLDVWQSKTSMDKSSEGGVQSTGTAIRPPITTHVLDVSLGKPGAGIDVKLERCIAGEGENSSWDLVGSSNTNSDGRCEQLMEISNHVEAGTYRLTFDTGKYVERTQGEGKAVFYPYVHVVFVVQPHQVSEHFHVPLLFAPYSYTTYRGS
ncbi:hypothetical protein R1sor_014908 [Riccia sorocarpa]|uniref:Hydroxyisourate hydrolase n=1 Tax=Riccia sorocarpa TaxID=122646 RepID=A0ABD3HEK7_9MARC